MASLSVIIKRSLKMPDPVTAIVVSSVAGGLSSSSAAHDQSESARYAADAQLKANEQNIAFQKWLYGEQVSQNKPWYEAGTAALGKLNIGIDNGAFDPGKLDTSAIKDPGAFNGSAVNLFADPGYQFRMEQGQKALDRSAAARGLTQSGAQLKALTDYGQGMGSQEYGNAYNRAFQQYGTKVDHYGRNVNALTTDYNANANRLQNQFSNLFSISNAGQNAANQNNNAATNSGAQISNSLQNNGNALANMYTAQGNAAAAGAAGIATSANQGIQNYLSYNAMQKNPYSGYQNWTIG